MIEQIILPSGRELKLYDTLIHKKSKVWYRIVNLSEVGAGIKSTEMGEGGFKKQKAAKYVPFDVIEKDYTIADFPPVKYYVDESLIEKASPEKQEKEKLAAKEAYAAKKHSIERTRRKHR